MMTIFVAFGLLSVACSSGSSQVSGNRTDGPTLAVVRSDGHVGFFQETGGGWAALAVAGPATDRVVSVRYEENIVVQLLASGSVRALEFNGTDVVEYVIWGTPSPDRPGAPAISVAIHQRRVSFLIRAGFVRSTIGELAGGTRIVIGFDERSAGIAGGPSRLFVLNAAGSVDLLDSADPETRRVISAQVSEDLPADLLLDGDVLKLAMSDGAVFEFDFVSGVISEVVGPGNVSNVGIVQRGGNRWYLTPGGLTLSDGSGSRNIDGMTPLAVHGQGQSIAVLAADGSIAFYEDRDTAVDEVTVDPDAFSVGVLDIPM